jgi:adhesin/invasin
VNVTVNAGSAASNTLSVPVSTAAPGLFAQDGAAIVQNFPDYSLNGSSNPAKAGSTIIAYLTGSGPVSPAVADGAISPASPANATAVVTAKIGDSPAAVSFTGLAPGFVGLVQVNLVVPSGLAPGVYPLIVTIDGQASNSATIAVK